MRSSEIFACLDRISLARPTACVEELLLRIDRWSGLITFGILISCLTNLAWVNLAWASNPSHPISFDGGLDQSFVEIKQLLSKRKWNEAIPLLKAHLKREPKSVPAILGLVTALSHLGQREEA